MEIKDIQEMINKVPEQQILIIQKEFYEENKQEIDNLLKNNWNVDVCITNTLDEKTKAIVMPKKLFYGIDYGM